MPFRFRKTVKIAPGIKFNFNKKSTSISVGGKHAGFTISPTTGAHIRASAYGTGVSYRKKLGTAGKKRRTGGTAAQRRLLREVRELEGALELLRAEEEMDEAMDTSTDLVGCAYIPEEEVRERDTIKPDTKAAVRASAAVNGVLGVLGLGFLSWIFYNWAAVRVALYGGMVCWAVYCVRQIIRAEAVAKENAKHNLMLENQESKTESEEKYGE